LNDDRLVKDEDGRAKLYADIAHPINSACREMIQQRVIRDFQMEVDRSKLPGYRSTYDDYDHDTEVPPEVVPQGGGEPKRSPAGRPTTQVQPAEPQPRSPHKPPSQQPGHSPSQANVPHQSQRDSFGAGIF
jgi:stage V sporulation protein G